MLFSLFYGRFPLRCHGTNFGQFWPNNWLGSWRVAISKGCACSPRMIDARFELNWKWRGNPSDPFIGALPSNWWKTKQNHRKLWKFAILTQNLDYFNVSIYSLKIQTNFGQIVLFSGHKHGEKFSFWKLTPPGLQPLDAKWRWSCHVSYEIFTMFEYALTAEILYTVP